MNPCIEKINQYLAANPLTFSDGESILEFLWWAYSEEHPIDNDAVREKFEAMARIWNALPAEDSDLLFTTTCSLCLEYQRLSFCEGVKVGLHLFAE